MTIDTAAPDTKNPEDDFDSGFAAPPDDQAENTEAAPSTEGVVTSEADKAAGSVAGQEQPPVEATEQKPVNLGALSTKELLQRVRDNPTDPATLRAMDIRIARLEASDRPRRQRSKEAVAAEEAIAGTKAALTKMRPDYPEFAEHLETFSKAIEVTASTVIAADDREQLEADLTAVDAAFPGYRKLREEGCPQLAQWIARQPPEIQQLAQKVDVPSAMQLLERFELDEYAAGRPSPFAPPAPSAPVQPAFDVAAEAARIKADREKRLSSAAAVPNAARASIKPPDDDFDAGFAGRLR